MRIEALNAPRRGAAAGDRSAHVSALRGRHRHPDDASAGWRSKIAEPGRVFTEEERSRVPSVFTVLRAIIAAVPHRPGSQSRPLRRLRLRPRLPVRSGRLPAGAQGEPARPGALPARRDPGRRPLFGQGLDRPLRLFRRRLLDRGPAARRRGGAVQAVRPHPAARRPRARRICPPRREGEGELSGAATCSRWCRARCSTSAARRSRRKSRGG